MPRSIFIVFLLLIGVGIAAVGFAAQRGSAPTDTACQLVDIQGTPNIQVALAIDSLYEAMPQMKTPVAMVVTQEKPFTVGCVLPGD